LVKYLVYRIAYDESTAWFRVQHCLKPLRLMQHMCYARYKSRTTKDYVL